MKCNSFSVSQYENQYTFSMSYIPLCSIYFLQSAIPLSFLVAFPFLSYFCPLFFPCVHHLSPFCYLTLLNFSLFLFALETRVHLLCNVIS